MEPLWLIATDYERPFTEWLISNGWIDREWSLPFAFCPECDMNEAHHDPLPIACPTDLKAMLLDARRKWRLPRIPRPEFEPLLSKWQKAFEDSGGTGRLRSGDKFAPAVWHVPVKPQRSLYNPITDGLGYILPADVCNALLQQRVKGLHPVGIDSVRYMTDDNVHAKKVFMNSNSADQRRQICTHELSEIKYVQICRIAIALMHEPHEVREVQCKLCRQPQRQYLPEYDQRMERLRNERHIPAKKIPDVDFFVAHPARGILVKDRAFKLLPAEILVDFDIQEWTPLM